MAKKVERPKKLILSYLADGSWKGSSEHRVEYSFTPSEPVVFSGFLIEVDAEEQALNIQVNGENLLSIFFNADFKFEL